MKEYFYVGYLAPGFEKENKSTDAERGIYSKFNPNNLSATPYEVKCEIMNTSLEKTAGNGGVSRAIFPKLQEKLWFCLPLISQFFISTGICP